jgi:hypothetical protein
MFRAVWTSLEIFAATAGMAAPTWWSYRTGVDRVVERDRNPTLFKVNMALKVLLVAIGFVGGVLSLIYR